jgi:hypothetical protein
MIINTGMRTDIPAFFSKWLFNRINDGFVLVRNPYNPQQVTRYRLTPDVVDCLAFCTKDPAPMLDRIHELDAYGQFWFVTITPYGKEIEPNVPHYEEVIDSFKKLSSIIGAEKVSWRYDPIFINETYTLESHLESFEKMSDMLSGYTRDCVISFIDLYEKTKRNFPGINTVSREERHKLVEEFVRIGRKKNISIKTCAEGKELSRLGADCSGCMSKPVVERAIGNTLLVPKRKPIREGCDCLLGNDIGAYNSCGHGCIYCYANHDRKAVMINLRKHDPTSPFLLGGHTDGDIVSEGKQESFIDRQLSFF